MAWGTGQGEGPVAATARKFVPELRRLGLDVQEKRARTRCVVGMKLSGDDGDVVTFPRNKAV